VPGATMHSHGMWLAILHNEGLARREIPNLPYRKVSELLGLLIHK
jgi:hypothetical protein